jgi:hypothetical protein
MRDIKQYFWKHPFKEPCHPQTYINTKSIFLIIIPRLVVDPQLSENALPLLSCYHSQCLVNLVYFIYFVYNFSKLSVLSLLWI